MITAKLCPQTRAPFNCRFAELISIVVKAQTSVDRNEVWIVVNAVVPNPRIASLSNPEEELAIRRPSINTTMKPVVKVLKAETKKWGNR
ncbi:hypothetical protein ACT3QV_004786 [Vibrio alginolyticus]